VTTEASERLHGLDALRGTALLAGVALHATLSFMPGRPIWVAHDREPSYALAILFYVVHMARMPVFFLIAGFFARLALMRKGLGGFVADRLRRIALPLVLGWPLVFGTIVAVVVIGVLAANNWAPPPGPPPPPLTLETFPLTHLWFLYVLLIFYAAALGLRGIVILLDWRGGLRRALDVPFRWLLSPPLAPLILAIPAALAFWFAPHWLMWFGVVSPDTGFIPNTIALAAFGTAFAAGWLAESQRVLLARWARWAPLFLLAGAGVSVLCLQIVGIEPVLDDAARDQTRLLYGCLYSFGAWCWTLSLVGGATAVLSGYSPTRRWIADASYWVYIVHFPIVTAFQFAVAGLEWPWPVKYALILAATLGLAFGSYQLLVRYSFIGWILNGRRRRRVRDAGPELGLPSPAPVGSDTL
jgi:peptidoglycan/LPS O-acetylase OafA/YrhL